MTDIDAHSSPTLMPDNWLSRANSAAPRTRGDGTFADAMGREERVIDEKGLFGQDGFSFKTVLDTINPLQHIPIVSTIYRELTGDIPAPASQVAGGALFGGVIGFVASLFNVQVEGVTGKDIGAHAVAALNEDNKPAGGQAAPATAIAAAKPGAVVDAPMTDDLLLAALTGGGATATVAAAGQAPRVAAPTPPAITTRKAATNVALDDAGNRPAALAQAGRAPAGGGAPVVNAPMTDDLLLAALTGRDGAAAASALQDRAQAAPTQTAVAMPGAIMPAAARTGDAVARPGAIPIAAPVAGAAPRVLTQTPADAKAVDSKAADKPAETARTVAPPAEGTPGNPIRWMPAHPAGTQGFALPDPGRLPPALAQRVSDSYRKSLLSAGAGAREQQ